MWGHRPGWHPLLVPTRSKGRDSWCAQCLLGPNDDWRSLPWIAFSLAVDLKLWGLGSWSHYAHTILWRINARKACRCPVSCNLLSWSCAYHARINTRSNKKTLTSMSAFHLCQLGGHFIFWQLVNQLALTDKEHRPLLSFNRISLVHSPAVDASAGIWDLQQCIARLPINLVLPNNTNPHSLHTESGAQFSVWCPRQLC